MAITRATVRLNMKSGLPEDSAINVWHFEHAEPLSDVISLDIADGLNTFYQGIDQYYSQAVSRVTSAHSISFAAVSVGSPGPGDDTVTSPQFIENLDLVASAPGGTIPLPAEVAACLSFHGDYTGLSESGVGGIRPRSRKRGRLFLGPFNSGVVNERATTSVSELFVTFQTAVLDAYEAMVAAISASTPHVIYSPTLGSATQITHTWIDNAFDTVRSRGEAASSREERTL